MRSQSWRHLRICGALVRQEGHGELFCPQLYLVELQVFSIKVEHRLQCGKLWRRREASAPPVSGSASTKYRAIRHGILSPPEKA